jgi:calcium-dependent protein kinase
MGSKVGTATKEDYFAFAESESSSEREMMTQIEYQREMKKDKQASKDILDTIWNAMKPTDDIRNVYIFDKKELGHGHFGSVRRAKLINFPLRNYAVKTICKKRLDGDIFLLKRELEISRMINHPNLVKFYEYYQDESFFHIVMELCQGGDLMSKLLMEKRFDEKYATKVAFQILYAVNHMHSQGVCHRNLCLQDILILNKEKPDEVRIIDFGLAKMFSSAELKTKVGSHHYIAPEVFGGVYDKSCDIWSIGVMIYTMVMGKPPFRGRTDREIHENIKKGNYSMTGEDWEQLSAPAKDLISKMLKVKAAERPTLLECMHHPWIHTTYLEIIKSGQAFLKKDLLERLKGFQKKSLFQREIIKLMIPLFDDAEEIQRLAIMFRFLDKQLTGTLSTEEIAIYFNDYGEAITVVDIEELFMKINVRFKNTLTLFEFISITIEPFFYRDEKNLKIAFQRLNAENESVTTMEIMRDGFDRMGFHISPEDFAKMMEDVVTEQKSDAVITFEDFKRAMRKVYN